MPDILSRHPCGSAFSMIELLIAMSVIAVLSSILIPSIAAVRKNAQRVGCLNDMRQLGSAVLAYTGDNRGQLPPSQIKSEAVPAWHLPPGTHYNWSDPMLAGAYLDLSGWSGGATKYKNNTIMLCPADKRGFTSGIIFSTFGMNYSYAPFINNLGEWNNVRRAVRFDRPSLRALVIEANESRWFPGWGIPVDMYMTTTPNNYTMLPCSPTSGYNWRAFHGASGANVQFLDGHAVWCNDPQGEARANMILVR